MVIILAAAAVLSGFLGKWLEAGSILAIVILFIVLGFIQEYRAERGVASLRRLAAPRVRVFRDGALVEMASRDLVPGDRILLESGNMVPADVRFQQCVNLRIQEAALTGESEPIEKTAETLREKGLPLGDRLNLGFMGTIVTYGRGSAIVVTTGMRTELGTVAALIREASPERTPLQKNLDRLGRTLAVVGSAAAALVFAAGLALGESVKDMLITAVSVAVAVIPEGLPAVATVALALGARRMLRRNALIRRLPAVETLGSVTVICSDKTGTLTENRMTVMVIDVAGHRREITETIRHRVPHLAPRGAGEEPVRESGSILLMLAGGALCSDAMLSRGDADGSLHAIGDPTEGALVLAAARFGLDKERLEAAMPRRGEIPFDSQRKRMTTIHERPSGASLPSGLSAAWGLPSSAAAPTGDNWSTLVAVTKGSVDGLLEISSGVWNEGRAMPLDDEWEKRIRATSEELAGAGMRILGVGFRAIDGPALGRPQDVERDLVFVGLFGIMDPPRREVRRAVVVCREAGIRPVMITGDHPLTARAIADELGMTGGPVAGAAELDAAGQDALEDMVAEVSVFARVSPEHKLRIVRALQNRGEVVAMTGDGVNDAPALRKADIGIAMGVTGTDVAKDAADMILLDDNFASIVAAVGEGRTVVENLRHFISFSLAGNLGKVLIMLLGPLFGIPVALFPIQLLWLNLLTDGLLGLGMGFEPEGPDTMRHPPSRAQILSMGMGLHVGWVGAVICALALGMGAAAFRRSIGQWQTMIFAGLAFLQVWEAFGLRSERESAFRQRLQANPVLLFAGALGISFQLCVLFIPFLRGVFLVQPLSAGQLALCAGIGGVLFLLGESEKLVLRRRAQRGGHAVV